MPLGQSHSQVGVLAPVFRKNFRPGFINALPEDLWAYRRFGREDGKGKEHWFKVHYGRNESAGPYKERDDFGNPGHQAYIDATLPYKLYKVEIEVTKFMIAATRGQGGYLEQFAQESKRSLEDLRHRMNRDLLRAAPDPTDTDGISFDSIGSIVDDGQVNGATGYAGITFATNPWWKPYIIAPTDDEPLELSLEMLQDMTEELETPERDAKITDIWTARGHFNDYCALMDDRRRYFNTMKVDGGYTGASFESHTIVSVPAMPKGDIYFLDESAWKYKVLNDFDTEEKSVMRDARYVVTTHYANLMCENLLKQGRIHGLAA